MKLSALLKPAIDAKMPHEAIMQMVLAFEAQHEAEVAALTEADEQRKAKGRERWHRWKEGNRANVSQHLPTVANDSRGGVTRVEDKTSNLDIEPQKKEQKEGALSREFDQFWTDFPNKVGKPKAREAFVKARKLASLEAILSGLSRYIASKPADRAWLNPATFLNQERWTDQPANVVPMARGSPRPMDGLIDSLLTQMDNADERSQAEFEGYQTATRRISAN